MTSRRNYPGDSMSGGRAAKAIEHRDSSMSHLSSVSRKPTMYGFDERLDGAHRNKLVDEDRLERVDGYLGKARGMDLSERSQVVGSFGNVDRRSLRDDDMLKIVRAGEGTRPEKGDSRLRDVASREKYRSGYGEEPKWVRNSSYNFDGIGSLRSSDYSNTPGSSNALLAGFIYETHKRMIVDYFQKGGFGLPFENRRLAEQVGPGTKVFLFDVDARELYGVFQAISYASRDVEASNFPLLQVRVRLVKDCSFLSEREFKDIIRSNYHNAAKFSINLSKDQVSKLLQCFHSVQDQIPRNLDTGRNSHLTLASSRSSLHTGPHESNQDFDGLSAEYAYGKEKRWRKGAMESRSLSSHSFDGQDTARLPSKTASRAYPLSSKVWSTDLQDYDVDEAMDDVLMDGTHLIVGGHPYSTAQVKQQTSRVFPISAHNGSGGRSETKYGDGDWRYDIDNREFAYRKRQPLHSIPWDDLKRRERSASPLKGASLRYSASNDNMHDRIVKPAYKAEPAFLSSRRQHHNDIDYNMPMDLNRVDVSSSHIHDMESKPLRHKAWEDKLSKDYHVSPGKGRSLMLHASTSQLSDRILASSGIDVDQDDRPLVSLTRRHPNCMPPEKGRYTSASATIEKCNRIPEKIAPSKSYLKDSNIGLASVSRKSFPGKDRVSMDSSPRKAGKLPVVQIRANFKTPGKSERIVKLVDSSSSGVVGDGLSQKERFHPWGNASGDSRTDEITITLGQKRKASVWSRISLPTKINRSKAGGSSGKGRGLVFSRLGPTANTFSEIRFDSFPRKKKKLLKFDVQTQEASQEAGLELTEDGLQNVDDEDFPDGHGNSVGVDRLNDESEKLTSDSVQSWGRKKHLHTVSSGDEAGLSDHGEFGRENSQRTNGGRRKLVRPALGGQANFDDQQVGYEFPADQGSPQFLQTHISTTSVGKEKGKALRGDIDLEKPLHPSGLSMDEANHCQEQSLYAASSGPSGVAQQGTEVDRDIPSYAPLSSIDGNQWEKECAHNEHLDPAVISTNSSLMEDGHPDLEADDDMSS